MQLCVVVWYNFKSMVWGSKGQTSLLPWLTWGHLCTCIVSLTALSCGSVPVLQAGAWDGPRGLQKSIMIHGVIAMLMMMTSKQKLQRWWNLNETNFTPWWAVHLFLKNMQDSQCVVLQQCCLTNMCISMSLHQSGQCYGWLTIWQIYLRDDVIFTHFFMVCDW